MLTKLLVANRGEIACRIARTCRRLGIQTVAVYSDADANARHTREADFAVRIGAAPARASYLDANAIMKAALEQGAQAIHPGYGFLSEKQELIVACEAAGIVFVGPHQDAIMRMGSKIESKRIARDAGVPCVPGYDGADQSEKQLAEEAQRIGFPLLIKASAGGGGKGMKRVDDASQFVEQLKAAQREAQAAFGDDKVLLERFIVRPRHLEVQLLGDKHGGLVHLFERECSIQRNYQKVIEEAPAAHLSSDVREALYSSALALGRSIRYDSTGTVEFVLDADDGDKPYFLEMNTRLQVEHPVTELTTGLDLVELQIRSAVGERLPFGQAAIRRSGWSIEARINAEVPEEGYRASFGRIQAYQEPAIDGVRIDSGIDDRSEVTPHYDSMLAKAIAFGATREVARDRLSRAVRELRIVGVQTNQPLLDAILRHGTFNEVLATNFLANAFPAGWAPEAAQQAERRCAAAAAWFFARTNPSSSRPLEALAGFRLSGKLRRARYVLQVGEAGSPGPVEIECIGPGHVLCHFDGNLHEFHLTPDGCMALSGRRYHAVPGLDFVGTWCGGDYREWTVLADVESSAGSTESKAGTDAVCADMPGVLAQLLVQAGQEVSAGTPVAVVEAMKLFHTLDAPRNGTVESLPVACGSTVNRGAALVILAPLTT